MKEPELLKLVLRHASRLGYRLFRNNTAKAYQGQCIWINKPQDIRVNPGDVLIKNARTIHAGLAVGSGDLIGFKKITVTQDMVGSLIAVFTSVEAKTGHGKLSNEQQTFSNGVQSQGGIAITVRPEDYKTKFK